MASGCQHCDKAALDDEMSRFENPPLPEGEEVVPCDIAFYKPMDSIVLKWISEELFTPLVDYLDQDLLVTPPSSDNELSEDEIEIIELPFRGMSIVEESHTIEKVTQEESVKEKGTASLLIEDIEIQKLAKENQTITIDEDPENVEGSAVLERNIERIDLDCEDIQTNCENEECGKEKASVVTKNIEEIDLDSDDSQANTTCKKNYTGSKERCPPKQGIASDIDKFIERMRRDSDDAQKSRYNGSPSQSSQRKRHFQSTGYGKSSKKRSSSLVRPKKMYRRCHSPDLTPQNSPRVRRRHSPIEWGHSPRSRERYSPRSRERYSPHVRERYSPHVREHYSPHVRERYSPRAQEHYSPRAQQHLSPYIQRHHSPHEWGYYPSHVRQYRASMTPRYLSPQDVMDDRGRHRSRSDSIAGRYSSPEEASKKKRQKIIHYIDANSEQGFELSEIKISSKVVKKRELFPTGQDSSEENFQRDSITDDPKSPKKVVSDPAKVDIKGIAFENYYCKECQLTLNSKLTWESHIVGKKHKKAMQCQAIHDVAKGSIRIPPNPEFASLERPRFAGPTAGKKLVFINEISKLQRTVDEHSRDPMPGLDRVIEIRSENVITYYCSLCDAPCQPVSIMPHLIGYSHQLVCLRDIDEEFYREAVLVTRKKSIMRKLLAVLFKHQDRYGKGRIRVYEEKPDPNAIIGPIEQLYFDRPGPSWGNVAMKPEHDESAEAGEFTNDEYLDTSKSDFYCKLCDSHMNNLNMWAAHVMGKRHIKNAKKSPGEEPGKKKAVKASSNFVSKLEIMLRKEARGEVIVGLDYIRETQSKNGEIYNCFLCCACATNYDILDHLLLTKHRTKYLEKLHIDGKSNGIVDIAHMDINNTYIRDNLIKGECIRMLEMYGSGKVEVYISKDESRGRILPVY